MCQAHQGRDSPPPEFAKIRCQKVGKSEMGKILVSGHIKLISDHALNLKEPYKSLPDVVNTKQNYFTCIEP